MARALRFRQVDVFADRPLAGNPLAVFLDADGLTDAEMQGLAREMNLSETTFVLRPTPAGREAGASFRLRIFMPAIELPFAGHPVIGSAWVLADEGRLKYAGPSTVVRVELGVGTLPVELSSDPAGTVDLITMTQGEPQVLAVLGPEERTELVEALGISTADLGWIAPDGTAYDAAAAPPSVVTTGFPYLVVPLRGTGVLGGLTAQRGASAAALITPRYGTDSLALVVGDATRTDEAAARVRVFCDPGTGILEDPATGSAAGPIGVVLGLLAGARATRRRLVIEQGVELGRPSRLEVLVDFGADGAPQLVRVAGRTVPILEGVAHLP
jgi:trans-2,3-dihydro-3-hydroxyanthranilate isomerase